jgi:FMN phosphatase YigB (HAD superfamily)
MDQAYFAGFNHDLRDPQRWTDFYTIQQEKDPKLPKEIPPVPNIDGEWLFHDMMTKSIAPDPWMFPALKQLKASGRYILAALSNTVIFPPGHRLAEEDFFGNPVRRLFDVFISSAHVGLRKPDPRMYQLALQEVNRYAKEHANIGCGKSLGWNAGVKADEILFLDDIGENLKGGRKQGFQTIKVPLGKTYEAVDELEKITGLKLAGTHPRIPIKPNYGGYNSKI